MADSVYDFKPVSNIPCYSFNSSQDRIALSDGTSDVVIYGKKGSSWEKESTLTEHSSRVYDIDWSKGNKLATCGADRNAYVWTEITKNNWKPSLVLLRINRAAISIRWSPNENKFAVGTGNKLICVCYYEQSNDWWVSKHIKKPIRSSVMSVDWHPQNNLLAAASTDFCVRIFSAAIKEVDKKPEPTIWGEKNAFGAVLAEFKTECGGWAHCVKFSPNGNYLLWVSHDSCISVADFSKESGYVSVLKLSTLPLVTCVWLNDTVFFAAGHDNKPYKFTYENFQAKLDKCIDDGQQGSKQSSGASSSAMSKFKNLDKMAQSNTSQRVSNSIHSNTIQKICFLSNTQISSSALDSQVVVWKV